MDIIYPDNELVYLSLNGVGANGVYYHLRANSYTPTLSDTLSNYTEVNLVGYAAINIPLASWNITQVANHQAIVQAPAISFTCTTGSATVYGYYVTDYSNTYLLLTTNVSTPYTLTATTPVVITPILGSYSEYSI
jgi:hypothetical protein